MAGLTIFIHLPDSIIMALNLSELTQQKKKPSRWVLNRTVASPLGEFPLELSKDGKDPSPPDEEMLKRGAELVRYVETHGEYLVDIVFGHYLFACELGWMESKSVPVGLTREAIASQLREDRSLSVNRDLDLELDDLPPYESFIYVVPLWDEEHGLSMLFQDGKVVRVNECLFALEDGVLRYLDEEEEEEEED